jgi:hypothetical protein
MPVRWWVTWWVTACALALATVAGSSALAVQVADGTVYFNRAPQLVNTSGYGRLAPFATDFVFSIYTPPDAGEPLQRIDIDLGDFGPELVISQVRVALLDRVSEAPPTIARTTERTEAGRRILSLVLSQPVAPGRTVAVDLRTAQISRLGGVYLFGITAFPRGEKAHGQFLGFGRVRIIDG